MVGLEDPQLVEINALQVSHAHGGDLDDCCIEKSMNGPAVNRNF
jgi:hypothetical protein